MPESFKLHQRIVGSRTRFRVMLNGHHAQPVRQEPLAGTVVQVPVRNLNIRIWFDLDCIPVVLRRNLNTAFRLVHHRLIRTTMSELELEGGSTQRTSNNLMPQTNAKNQMRPITNASQRISE